MTWKNRRMGLYAAVAALCIAWMPQSGAASERVQMSVPSYHVVEGGDFQTATTKGDRLMEEYRLSKYDVLSVQIVGFNSFSDENTKNNTALDEIMIGPDGYAQLPYAGSLRLAGLTLDEARDLISERMHRYLRFPELSVGVKTYGKRNVYVMGEVKEPGIQKLDADTLNTYAAISSAGGFTNRGRSTQVQVIRVVGDTMYYKQVNLKNYIKKHDLTQNLALQDGDIVYVPTSNGIKFQEDVLPYLNVLTMYKALAD